MVNYVCSLRRSFPGAHFARSIDPRVCVGCNDRAVADVLFWFAWAGGTAIDLELNGGAGAVIFDAANSDKIFAVTQYMLAPIAQALAWGMAVLIVVLLMNLPCNIS